MAEKKLVPKNIMIEPGQKKWLARYSRKHGLSDSAVIRQMIDQLMKRELRKKG